MDMNYLSEFMTLMQFGSYASAAKALFMTQSSLRRHIDCLEKEFGCELVFSEKGTGRLIPTNAGNILLKQTPHLLSYFEEMKHSIASLSSEPAIIRIQDKLHLSSLFDGIFDAIEETKERYPNVLFQYVNVNASSSPGEAIKQDKVDVAFKFALSRSTYADTSIYPPDEQGCIHLPIYHFHGMLGFGMGKNTSIDKEGRKLELKDFASQRFLTPAGKINENLIRDFRSLCADAGFAPQIEYVSNSSMLEFYASKPRDAAFLITCLPKGGHTTFDFYLKSNLTVIRPGYPDNPIFVNAVLISKNDPSNQPLQYFLEKLRDIEVQFHEKMMPIEHDPTNEDYWR